MLAFLRQVPENKSEPDCVSCNSAISACEVGQQWTISQGLLSTMPTKMVKPDVVSLNAAMIGYVDGHWWERAVAQVGVIAA